MLAILGDNIFSIFPLLAYRCSKVDTRVSCPLLVGLRVQASFRVLMRLKLWGFGIPRSRGSSRAFCSEAASCEESFGIFLRTCGVALSKSAPVSFKVIPNSRTVARE